MKGNKLKKMLTPGFQLIKAICCFLISINLCVCVCVCVCLIHDPVEEDKE